MNPFNVSKQVSLCHFFQKPKSNFCKVHLSYPTSKKYRVFLKQKRPRIISKDKR